MIRTALLLCAGLLAAACFACVQQTPHAKAVPVVCTSQGITDGQTFVSKQKIQYLYGNPDPSARYPNYNTPTGYGPIGSPFDYYIIAAFDNAPEFFKGQLCNLTRVFINLNSCTAADCLVGAWGYREQPAQFANGYNGPYAGYIAISQGLWTGGGWAQTYNGYETALLRNLLGWNAPYFDSATPNDFSTTVLAALAHELGHVRWYETFVRTPGGNQNLKGWCDGNFFDSWQGGWASVHAPPKWRELLNPVGRSKAGGIPDKHKNPPQTKDIENAIAAGQFDGTNGAGDLLNQLYIPQAPWASFFASLAPDEDFVETYKLYVLANAGTPLTSLSLTIPTNPGYQEDIPNDYLVKKSKTDLANKMACFP